MMANKNKSDDYESSYKSLAAKLLVIDEAGFETEMQEIDNPYFIESATLNYEAFKSRPDLISESYIRKDGIIKYSRKGDFAAAISSHNDTYYDHGYWQIGNPPYSGESKARAFEDRKYSGFVSTNKGIVLAIDKYDANTGRILKVYPHLKEYTEQKKLELMESIDKKINSLESTNKKLKEMLQRALTFAQTVRDSTVGKIFFGKKAKEVLGEQDKNAKQLPDGR